MSKHRHGDGTPCHEVPIGVCVLTDYAEHRIRADALAAAVDAIYKQARPMDCDWRELFDALRAYREGRR
jgi:hypothetical protein